MLFPWLFWCITENEKSLQVPFNMLLVTPVLHLGMTEISLKPAYTFAAGVIGHRHVAGVLDIPKHYARA